MWSFSRTEKSHPAVDQPRRRWDGRESQLAAGALEAAPYTALLINHLAVPSWKNRFPRSKATPMPVAPSVTMTTFRSLTSIVEDPIPGQQLEGIELYL